MIQNYQTAPLSNTGSTTLTFYQTTNVTYSGVISDVGNAVNTNYSLALKKMGAATFTFVSSGIDNYSGSTIIGQGAIAAGSASALSDSSAFVLSNSAGVSLNLNGFANTIASLAGGGTNGGNVNLGSNGVLTMGTNTSTTFAGVISGTGTAGITQQGTGTLILTGNNIYTGTTTINSGATIQVGTNGTSGSLGTGAVVDNGKLIINAANLTTLGGAISGSGSFQQIGSGTTVLSAANTYIGSTYIGAGVLQIGTNGTTGSLGANTGPVTNNGALVFNLATNRTFSNVITGTGSVGQIGSGTTTLAASNTYTGTTYLRGGVLALTAGGSINSSTNINLGLTNSRGTFDVSAYTNGYTIRTNQSLSGVGTIMT